MIDTKFRRDMVASKFKILEVLIYFLLQKVKRLSMPTLTPLFINSVAATIANFLLGMCNCTVDSDVGMGDFLLMLGILHMCRHVHKYLHA